MEGIALGFKCQKRGRRTVVEKVIPSYHMKIKGYPFIVKDGRLGVCDKCSAKHFDAGETDRWEEVSEAEQGKHYLQPEEIKALQTSLSLIGCTR